jgi:hypothetical protein
VAYLQFMINTIFEIFPFFQNRTDPSSLSAILILTYLLNSLVHAPPTRFQHVKLRPISKFIMEHRCSTNSLLFLPSIFSFDGETVKCHFQFSNEFLVLCYPQGQQISSNAPALT